MDFKVFIEIPAGGKVKYEVDEETRELKVDRFLHTAFTFPFNYGFIKNTKGQDNDPLDVLVLSTESVFPGVVMKCHCVGLLDMEDEGGVDTKILAVPDIKIDPIYGAYSDTKDLPEALLAEIKNFFENYKTLEPDKWVKVKDFKGAQAAEEEVKKASL